MSDEPSYLDTLNDQQKRAVTHGKAPLLILAGAGSGKTRVITTRIAYLIQKLGFVSDQILAVTFTNKAAREMQERVSLTLGNPTEFDNRVMIKTFHSFCAWLLRRNAALAGLSPYFGIYDDEDSLALVKSVLPAKFLPSEAKKYQQAISRAKDDNLTPQDDLSLTSSLDCFPEIFKAYEDKLIQSGNVDFGGLIQKTVLLLRNNGGLRNRIQQKFQVILVDEYQDCNGAQSQLLKELFSSQTWLAVVGDDDQSIYRFRGADVGHILSFPNNYPGTEIIRLEQNYRSTGKILDIAGQVVEKNQGRLGKKLWTENGEGETPCLVCLEDQDAEALWAVQLIKKTPLTETAILYRTNAQSRAFESAFVRAKIPYKIVGTVKFYEREEVKDVLAWLSLLGNPLDEIAFKRIINKPARGLGKSALENIYSFKSEKLNWLDASGYSLSGMKGKAKAGLNSFLNLFGKFASSLSVSENLADVVQEIIETSGLADYHASQDEHGANRVKNLDELINASTNFSGGMEGLAQFLESVELDAESSLADGEMKPGTVTLITMHNTKGLEFDRVLITGMEEGLFPREDTIYDREEIEEERRLFYVAVTRARKELYFTTCSRRLMHGQFQDKLPSRFLREIEPNSFTVQGTAAQDDGWKVGQRVYREDFGIGTVIKKRYEGTELVLEVRFDSGKLAKYLPVYTPLEKVAQDE